MVKPTIFLLLDGKLMPLTETPFENEPLLQKALAEFPQVLAGPATAGEGGQLLLIDREVGVPGGSGGLSLDHLFVDRDGVPVLVEVKRSSDTRVRREVVAQMLDYAANGSKYWPVERLAALLEQRNNGRDAAELLREAFADDELDADRYWRTVDSNLRAGRMRLIFLADRLPEELVRIIEFLNEQMRETEVLGVEVPQYVGADGHIAYVPRVVGLTAQAKDTKRASTGLRWNVESFMDTARDSASDAELHFLQRLLDHNKMQQGRFSWGTGANPGVSGWYMVDGLDTPVWNVSLGGRSSTATFYFIFGEYATRQGAIRTTAYADAVAEIPTLKPKVDEAKAKSLKGWLSIPVADAAVSPALDKVFQAIDVARTPSQ